MRSLQAETCPVLSLPPEVLHRCLSQLDSEERCQSIPLVCKSFLQNHLDFPPMRKQWGMDGLGSVTASMVQWFLHAGSSCEPVWEGWKDQPRVPGDFELLCNFIMENLGGKGGQLLSSLLQCLSAKAYFLLAPDNSHDDRRGVFPSLRAGGEFARCSAGFQSLQAVTLCLTVGDHRQPTLDGADALFGALARVHNLRLFNIILPICVGVAPESLRPAVSTLFRSLGLLSQIRELNGCDDLRLLLDENGMLPQSLALLTQLRELDMGNASVPFSSFSPIMGLPHLECLQIAMEEGGQPSPLYLSSRKLTRLDILCGMASSADQYLPASLPYLGMLRHLRLNHIGLETFPLPVAAALTSLTHLDLSHNLFVKIPPEVAHLSTLQVIDMGQNRRLQLQLDDGGVLAALPGLQIANLSWGGELYVEEDGGLTISQSHTARHPDMGLLRRNVDMWGAIKMRHSQLAGLVGGI